MNWFKHDADASTDAKIKKLLIKYGAEGYAIYFHCLELIAGNISENNITFELEHDAEIIADNLKIKGNADKAGIDVVNDIMKYIVELGLFEQNNNTITCLKIAKRLDQSMTNNKRMRQLISDIKENNKGFIYIIKSEYGYKIGKTKNYENRIKLFDVKLPFKFDIIRLYKSCNYNNDETNIHKIYFNSIINGEWFNINDDDILNIDEYIIKNNGEIMTCHDTSCKIRIEEIRKDKKEIEYTEKPTKEIKHKYGEYNHVLLTDSQMTSVLEKLGDHKTKYMIKVMDEAIEEKGNIWHISNFAMALLKWAKKDTSYKPTQQATPSMPRLPRPPKCPTCGKPTIEYMYGGAGCKPCGVMFRYNDKWIREK